MEELLRQAYERRDRLRRELALVDNLIADYVRLESNTPSSSGESLELPFEDRPARPRRSRSKTPDLSAILDATESLIRDAGHPMSRGELVRLLEGMGFQFRGTDKIKVFGTNLWRSGRFLSLKGVGYWPKAHPLPAGYRTAEQRDSIIKRAG